MMAEALGISPDTLRHFERRPPPAPSHRGRPEVIDAASRLKIRNCYELHHKQWGPKVLAEWCRREGLGCWSPSTITNVIADLRETKVQPPPPRRYEITRSGVMWSEDGTGFEHGRNKQELLVAQDEHARFKVATRLARGPAKEKDVICYLDAAFQKHGAPLVLKHDGGKIFHGRRVRDLLHRWQVVDLTSPPYWPGYNGKQERSMRDIHSMVKALKRDAVCGGLKTWVRVALQDLNEERPRPVLDGCTAREVYERDRIGDIDRDAFALEVRRETRKLHAKARSRHERRTARRHAIEAVLSRHGLLREMPGNVN